MSDIYNPYAFGVLGNPAPLVAPPALRVVSGQATPEQIAMARDVFARFCSGARLSHVPHPAEIGRLPDGSAYRITDVAGTRTMLLSPAHRSGEEDFLPTGIFVVCTAGGRTEIFVFTPGGAYNYPDGSWAVRTSDLSQYVNRIPNFAETDSSRLDAPWANDVWAVDSKIGEYLVRGYGGHYRYGAEALTGVDGQFSGVVDRGVRQDAMAFQLGLGGVEVTEYRGTDDLRSALFGLRRNEKLHLPAERYDAVQNPSDWRLTHFNASRDGKKGLIAYRAGGVELLPWNGGAPYTQQYILLDRTPAMNAVLRFYDGTYYAGLQGAGLAQERESFLVSPTEGVAEFSVVGVTPSSWPVRGVLTPPTGYRIPKTPWLVEGGVKGDVAIKLNSVGKYPVVKITEWVRSAPTFSPDGESMSLSSPIGYAEFSRTQWSSLAHLYYSTDGSPIVAGRDYVEEYNLDITGNITGAESRAHGTSRTSTITGEVRRLERSALNIPHYGEFVEHSALVTERFTTDTDEFDEYGTTSSSATQRFRAYVHCESAYSVDVQLRVLHLYDKFLDLICFSECAYKYSGTATYSYEHSGTYADSSYPTIAVSNPNGMVSPPDMNLVIIHKGVRAETPLRFVDDSAQYAEAAYSTAAVVTIPAGVPSGVTYNGEPQHPGIWMITGKNVYAFLFGAIMQGWPGNDLPLMHDGAEPGVSTSRVHYGGRCMALTPSFPALKVSYARDPKTGAALLVVQDRSPHIGGVGTALAFTVDKAGVKSIRLPRGYSANDIEKIGPV